MRESKCLFSPIRSLKHCSMITIYSMRKTTIQDLKPELRCLSYNSGSIIWTTKDNKNIPIKDMNTNHLVNTFKMLAKQEAIAECFKDIMACDENDIL